MTSLLALLQLTAPAAQVPARAASFDWEKVVLAILGPIIGFAAGFAAFEYQERRRVRLAQRELRRALIGELQHIEVLLSTIVAKYAYLAESPEDVKATAAEIRWYRQVGIERAKAVGLSQGIPEPMQRTVEQFDALPDEAVVKLSAAVGRQETVGSKVILPIIEGVLAGRTAGFTDHEIQALSAVRWQAFMLEQEAEWTREFFRMTYTVTDPQNHDRVVQNHENRLRQYARRARTVLAVVRRTLQILGD